jgi:hypothetical protein
VPDLAVPRTVDGLMAWILEQPEVSGSTPQPLTLGGRPAAMVDLELSPSAGRDCEDAPQRSAALLTTAVAPTDGPSVIRVVGKEHARLILVDVGGGELAAILIADRDEAQGNDKEAFEAFVAEAMPIVQSMQFR